jgi:predicted MPP superfamily phosphohydrolase
MHRNGSSIHIAGIDDHLAGYGNLAETLTHLPEQSSAILLAHEPDFAEISAPTRRFSLQISGHSHGGQIKLPFIGAPYLPPLGRKYPGGLYQINGMKLYTNRGLGTSWLGIRINCPPEITVFNLCAVRP